MYIIIIIVVLLLALILYKRVEGFNSSLDFRHAVLNDFGGVEYVERYPPSWKTCSRYPCPEVFDQNIACWKCGRGLAEPQNNFW